MKKLDAVLLVAYVAIGSGITILALAAAIAVQIR